MKRIYLLAAISSVGAVAAQAETTTSADTVQNRVLEEIIVKNVKVKKSAPLTFNEISKEDIASSDQGQDIPYLLMQTPSVIATSDNGLGIGSTYFRVRGTDNTRVNFTLDGVPMNDSEDQAVFWANMNGFASGLDNIQIQRGVGSSTNGAGAFGATVAMKSAAPSAIPGLSLSGMYGSYNTYKYDVMGSTGLLREHWVFDARYTQSYTDGWIDRTGGKLGSYAASATYYGSSFMIRYRNFGSFENVGQCWNGVTPEEMKTYGRRYNPLGTYTDVNGETAYYPTTDNYWQNHNHLNFAWNIDANFKMNATVHYTHGYGYYDDLKAEAKLYKFGLDNFLDADGNKVKKTDLIRQKGLENDFVGALYNLNYTNDKVDAILGFGYNYFDGDHWGEVKWARNYPNLELGKHYYDSHARKEDANAFIKATYKFNERWNAYADLQYRAIDYRMSGNMDKFYTDENWNNIQMTLDEEHHWNFFNPKAGVCYDYEGHRAYASFAMAHREPTRNNYTDNGQFDPRPKSEQLLDYEVSYTYAAPQWTLGVNFYFMDYKDQLILNGQTSDIGEALTVNVPDSYRAGMEIQGAWQPCKYFKWSANATLSRNKVKDFTETLLTYDADWNVLAPTVTKYGDTDIAFSPSVIANNTFHFAVKRFTADVTTQYVSRQYLDNTECKERSLDAYCVSNLRMNYRFTPKFAKELNVGVHVNNLFNTKYENNGGAGGEVEDGQKVYWTWVFPQAGTTVFGTVNIKF